MKDVLQVLRQKEAELAMVRRQVECLLLVAPLLDEKSAEVSPSPDSESPIFRTPSHPLR